MRSNQNPSGSVTRGVGDRSGVAKLSMHQMPVEWLDSGSWRLPSGKALAEFALQAGFLAPLLFRTDGFENSVLNRASAIKALSRTTGSVAQARGKQFGKGDGR